MQFSTVGNSTRHAASGSPDNDPAFQVGVVRVLVVMEAAGTDDVEVAGLPVLSPGHQADLVLAGQSR